MEFILSLFEALYSLTKLEEEIQGSNTMSQVSLN